MTSVALRQTPPTRERGDAEETGRLFEEHSERIFGYCLRRLGSRSEAEDAVQTTFLYALRGLRRGVVPESESAWLFTIAKNVCRWQRRTLARRGPLASDVDVESIGLARSEPDDEGLLSELKDALVAIPEMQRRALVLREWQGVPPREIATELGMTATATYALLTRARQSLALALSAARRPVLGVAWLVFELRSRIRAVLAGASAKATVTTVIVAGAGAGVGGFAVERTLESDRSALRTPAVAFDRSHVDAGAASARLAQAGAGSPVAREASRRAAKSSPTSPRQSSTHVRGPTPVPAPPPSLRAHDPAREPEASPNTLLPTVSHQPIDLPFDPPPLPPVEPPTDLLPSVDPPPLPAVEPPTDPLPPVDPQPPPPVGPPSDLLPPVDPRPLPPLPTRSLPLPNAPPP